MIPNPTFARVARPGSAEDYFLGNNPEGLNFREFIGEAMDVIPAYQAPAPRLAIMDELGMDRCVMYPTLASLIEERTTDDVILTHAVMHALNEWMHEHWTFDYEGRIFATPGDYLAVCRQGDQGIPLVPRAQHEDFLVRPAPVPSRFGGSRSMGLPEFDPFWQEVVNAGIPVTMHASDSGYQKHLMEWEGGDEYLSFKPSALREVVMGHRAIEDTLAAMVCHGALSRFPDLKDHLRREWQRMGEEPSRANSIRRTRSCRRSSTSIRSRCSNATSTSTRSWRTTSRGSSTSWAEDHVMFGSDFPHPEGIGDPLSFVDRLDGVSERTRRRSWAATP